MSVLLNARQFLPPAPVFLRTPVQTSLRVTLPVLLRCICSLHSSFLSVPGDGEMAPGSPCGAETFGGAWDALQLPPLQDLV